ncbi:integrase family protein [Sphingomonas sp. CGMCC 1.13654]|uniref:Integrase family protein n=1 Tax=Sphingomonas chungangi TaxID=2683589 RepID=A0A838L4A5_9SPHN|nr:integrase family protein [Sphingomonas chungangi]MBA2934333.1 integrase family protein [Sphingomonas chungangi]MVW57373.1 tyrosine-type recombinase/integrase [Sphingomonas chungangi]
MTLNDLRVEGLQSGVRRRTIADRECDHLFLIVHPSDRKTWLWRGRIDGRPEKMTLGIFPYCDTKTARAKARNITAERAAGRNEVAEQRRAKQRERQSRTMTCDRAFELYIENYCRAWNKTWPEKKRIYDREVSPRIGSMPISEVEFEHLIPILSQKAVTAPIQSNRIRCHLIHWFQWCTRHGRHLIHLEANVARDLPRFGRARSRKRVLNDYELSLLMKVLNDSTSLYAEPVKFILHTGCRRAEAFEMRWDELRELEPEGNWILPAERSKNQRELVLPLPAIMVEMLKDRRVARGDSQLVWPTMGRSGKGMSGFSKAVRSFQSAMRELAAEDGSEIDHWVLHDLRRTFITRMHGIRDQYKRRFPRDTIFSVTNHKLSGMPGIYNRYDYYEDKREALEAWAKFLENLKVRECRQLSLFT